MTPTFEAIQLHHWHIVLLQPGTKRPKAGQKWETTTNLKAIEYHLKDGGGIGIDVFESGIVILDFDEPYAEACAEIGPLPPATSTSPSGGFHHYFLRPSEPMPAVITWRDRRLGEVIRGPRQHAVMPPSPYPGKESKGIPPGGNYKWIMDPRIPLFAMPRYWIEFLAGVPSYIEQSRKGQPRTEWDGPSAEEILARAQRQPGATRRARGVKFQCPACCADGHDKHRDNAVVFLDGRWACAFAPGSTDVESRRHKMAIGVALGVVKDLTVNEPEEPEIEIDEPEEEIEIKDDEREKEIEIEEDDEDIPYADDDEELTDEEE
jgi:hypothetical protein